VATLSKTLIGVIAGLLIGGGAIVTAATTGDDNPKRAITTTTAAVPARADVKGPCDEAEHANDPRCAGPQVPEDNHRPGVEDRPNHDVNDDRGDDGPNHDVNDDRGRENEIEPGDDRGADHGRDRGHGLDNSGPGNARDRGEAVIDNSGPGNAEDRGGADDPAGDDHSGSGSGDDSPDSSGSGSSGRS
jgi:hypothetical protein